MSIGAIFWLGVLGWVLYIGACWIAYKGEHLRFWLAYSIVPWLLILTAFAVGAPVPRLVVWLYSYSLPALPIWWLYRLVYHPAVPEPARDDFSDLVPLPDAERRWKRPQ